MNRELIISIKSFIKKNKIDCDFVTEAESKILLEKLACIFSFDLANKYLWENISMQSRIDYTDNVQWEMILHKLLENFRDRIYLVVTDDDFYPWAVLDCNKSQIIDIIKEQSYFEYFLFDLEMKKILFDTHENQLLITISPQ